MFKLGFAFVAIALFQGVISSPLVQTPNSAALSSKEVYRRNEAAPTGEELISPGSGGLQLSSLTGLLGGLLGRQDDEDDSALAALAALSSLLDRRQAGFIGEDDSPIAALTSLARRQAGFSGGDDDDDNDDSLDAREEDFRPFPPKFRGLRGPKEHTGLSGLADKLGDTLTSLGAGLGELL